jgi:hypothetical protein
MIDLTDKNDTYRLNDQMIPYKEHIRKIVDTATVHERNNWHTYFTRMYMTRNIKLYYDPPKSEKIKTNVVYIIMAFLCGILGTIYAFKI